MACDTFCAVRRRRTHWLNASFVSLRSAGVRTDRNQIGVDNRTNIGNVEREEGLGLAGGRHELDLQGIRLIDLNDRAEVAELQTVARKVFVQHYNVERLE